MKFLTIICSLIYFKGNSSYGQSLSCMSASFLKPVATILANINLFNVLGKMHVANSDGAFVTLVTTSLGVSWANSVHPAYNMITNTHICQAFGLICDELMNIHASNSTTSPQIGTIKMTWEISWFSRPSSWDPRCLSIKKWIPLSQLNRPCHMPLSMHFHQWTPTTLAILLKMSMHPMATFIETTICFCANSTFPREERTCIISFEEIVSFVTGYLRKNVQILSTSGAPPGLA